MNAECHIEGTHGVCTCIEGYFGNPYKKCGPECVINSECPQYLACIKQKCVDPCPGTCGINAYCEVHNHNPICSCPRTMTGDPFDLCEASKSISFFVALHKVTSTGKYFIIVSLSHILILIYNNL